MSDGIDDDIDVFGPNWPRLTNHERAMILRVADDEPSLVAMIKDLSERESLNSKLMLDCLNHLTFFEHTGD